MTVVDFTLKSFRFLVPGGFLVFGIEALQLPSVMRIPSDLKREPTADLGTHFAADRLFAGCRWCLCSRFFIYAERRC